VLTNNHVVAGAISILVVVTDANGTEQIVTADILGTDADVDLAVIRMETGSYVPVEFGSVKDIDLGDEVVALGYPLTDETDASLTVTKGIVSSIRNDGSSDVIQHQASINPGNSGGPLVSSDGLVVGVNTYILRRSQDVNIEGFNVAVAIDEAVPRMDQLETAMVASRPADAFYSSGLAYYYRGEYERALEDWDDAIRLNSQDDIAFYARGLAYYNLSQYERAIQDYDEAIRLNPQDADSYVARGSAYDDLGQSARAIEDYDEAIRIDPQDDIAYNDRGLAYYNLGQYGRAIVDYDEAIRLDPQDPDAIQ
jgi:tetratricopeptide (TPR) repeat protein